ncbi:MAG: SulP family inorganic anion transporter [Flavobacteriaceae bacterium]|nr:SulP family inorganic anion transporter [Flavobacteriaceae bacterium]
MNAFGFLNMGVFITGFFSLLAIILWDKFKPGMLKIVPGALLGVVVGLLVNFLFKVFHLDHLSIQAEHLVNIPKISGLSEATSLMTFPDFTQITNKEVWIVAVTIAIVASIETLLTIEATDKLDPLKRVTPTNRELLAQGAGNTLSGLMGGLPITSVIVRSSANINSGGKTKTSTIFHGLLLLIGTLFFAGLLNYIPLTSLAAILLVTGWKLANPQTFKAMFSLKIDQWLTYIVTVVAIVFTDLLVGIMIGITVSIIVILIKNLQNTHFITRESVNGNKHLKIILSEEVSFLNKASVLLTLDRISPDSKLIIDASNTFYIDYDVLEVIKEFVNIKSKRKNIDVVLKGFKETYGIVNNDRIDMETT